MTEPLQKTSISESELSDLIEKVENVRTEMAKALVGQQATIELLMVGLLAGGHCLLEGVPGLAKTLMISSLSKALDLDFKRIQFTPDMMPSDVIGTEILEEDHSTGKRFFKFQKGPVFTNLLLADEINRTPPKTQAALLEAMQERVISFAGEEHILPKPFFVLATQNPIEQAGTYALPEAQLDRFLLHLKVDYPNYSEEVEILKRTTGVEAAKVNAQLDEGHLLRLQSLTRSIIVADELIENVATLVRLTRPKETNDSSVKKYIRWGAGPRAGQSILLAAKAKALLAGRLSVIPSDIEAIYLSALSHRILLTFEAQADGISIETLMNSLFKKVFHK
ncbi:MAG: AAA family ATPase [Gammaproteobacteria bacterium]|nr:AAA family ATPase [Gammaproteobacteria bacterium]